MKHQMIDNVVFMGILAILAYQYTLLYFSVINGEWLNFLIVAGTFGLGLLLGRSTYIILGGMLSFVGMSAGGLMLVMPYTRELYLWSAVALLTITPMTTYLTYLLDHHLLKRKALAAKLSELERAKPDVELITGAQNKHALDTAVTREMNLVLHHERDYHFTLTMVKIDFLESVVNFLGSQRFNALLRSTATQLTGLQNAEDQLFYLGAGKFVILSPMLSHAKAPILRYRFKSHVDQVASVIGLERNALVLRIGQVTYATHRMVSNCNVNQALAQLERSAETDIVKEYL